MNTTTAETHKGFRFAELARGESLQSPDVCDCCGRDGLKRTVKLINPAGRVVWFGSGCAARAMSVGIRVVNDARKQALELAERRDRAEREQVARLADQAWQAFLDRRAGAGVNRFTQIQRLGGYTAARALFTAA